MAHQFTAHSVTEDPQVAQNEKTKAEEIAEEAVMKPLSHSQDLKDKAAFETDQIKTMTAQKVRQEQISAKQRFIEAMKESSLHI